MKLKREKGIYLILCENENLIENDLNYLSDCIFVNLNLKKSIKVNQYFKKNKLDYIKNSLISASNLPNELYSVVNYLLKKTDCIVIGTAGLSFDSIVSIVEDVRFLHKEKTIYFISYFKEDSIDFDSYKIFNIKEIGAKELRVLLQGKA
ncbi:hypothetical protein [Flavobacterium sp. CLA17]|uniref:hypothetical protein n=1 Tax=Flavobacterium sp. CLA17 TaxID=2724135 RepID=UPI0014920AB2|nr:hypothetical protein [Flavobacterium sp. CLA17]QSB26505.1 hypothetical protein HAV12_019390 [Flavobacterium sp. CLA17]